MLKVHEVKKVYCYEYDHYINENGQNCCKVEYTTDVNEAMKLDKNFRWVDIDEIQEAISLGFDIIPVVETDSGIYGFMEIRYLTFLGDEEYFGNYIFLQPNVDWEIRDFRDYLDRCIAEMK